MPDQRSLSHVVNSSTAVTEYPYFQYSSLSARCTTGVKPASFYCYALAVMGSTLLQLDHIAGSTIIQFTDTDPALLKVDAVVEEQDTNLVLGKSPVIMDTIESFPALIKKMEQQAPEIPGNVIVKRSVPKRFIAIIYDVEHMPICKKKWIRDALKNILAQCVKHRIQTLAMPLLGTSYGKLKQETAMHLMQDSLMKNRQQCLKKIFIYEDINQG